MVPKWNTEELKEGARDARSALERERDELVEKVEKMNGYLRVLDATEQMLSENRSLKDENESLRAQLQEERERNTRLEMQLNEMSKLSASVAGKASHDELLKAMRVFVNKSKRKKIEKRIAVKEMVLELAVANTISLPEDLAATIESLDDEQVEPKLVSVQGNYNDIHDNSNVKLAVNE